LSGGGDLDIFYRVLRAGLPQIFEPRQLIYHQHRREYRAIRRQMYTWGLGIMAYAVRNYRYDPAHRLRFRCMMLGWFRTLSAMTFRSFRRGNVWKPDLALAELWGGIVGVCGEYGRSVRRVERIRKQYAP
ncbi:MAG TPA: hypothetical protein VHB50_01085, partial [Bryobacteraceae bacterium]|nr:hypothetical protein [Bryobacteraceae bacterium]